MKPTLYSSGSDPIHAGDDWTDVLDIPGVSMVNWINLIHEGDESGFWRLVDHGGDATDPVRLPAGPGDVGLRRTSVNIPVPGFAGKLQVKGVRNVYAFGMK